MNLKISKIIFLGGIFSLFFGCKFTPKGIVQFQEYPQQVKIPVTCNLVIPQSTQNYSFKSGMYTWTIGPLFTENVPRALKKIIQEVNISNNSAADIFITAELNSFSIRASVLKLCVTHELFTKNKRHLITLTSKQSIKAGSAVGNEIMKQLLMVCLDDLNEQLLAKKNFIIQEVEK